MLVTQRSQDGFVVLTNASTGIGVEVETAMRWFGDVAGERPAFATQFQRIRTGARWFA